MANQITLVSGHKLNALGEKLNKMLTLVHYESCAHRWLIGQNAILAFFFRYLFFLTQTPSCLVKRMIPVGRVQFFFSQCNWHEAGRNSFEPKNKVELWLPATRKKVEEQSRTRGPRNSVNVIALCTPYLLESAPNGNEIKILRLFNVRSGSQIND